MSNATPFAAITALDLLNADSRPTFAIGDDNCSGGAHALQPIFLNKALLKLPDLIQVAIENTSSLSTYPEFCHWVYSGYDKHGALSPTFSHATYDWNRIKVSPECTVIGGIGGTPSSSELDEPHSSQMVDIEFEKTSNNEWEQGQDLDWTRSKNPQNLTRYAQFLRSHDWELTSIGPIETWESELRLMVNLMLASPHGVSLFWGEDLVYLYNDFQIPSIGVKHPAMLGKKCADAWAEVFTNLRHIFAKGFETGEATETNQLLYLDRNGFLEETHYTFTIIPVIKGNGKVAGFYCPVHDITAQVFAQRRLNTVLMVNQHSAGALSCDELWKHLLSALEWNKEDIVFAALYSYESGQRMADGSNIFPNKDQDSHGTCKLAGAVGIPTSVLDEYIDIEEATSGIAQSFQTALSSDSQILLRNRDGSLPTTIVDVVDSTRGHGTKCEKAVLLALRPTNSGRTLGFVLLGLQSKCLYDEDYRRFTDLLGGQIAAALAATVTHQEEIRRREEQGNLEQAILQAKLLQQERETKSAERRFRSVFDLAASSIGIARPDGSMIYVNNIWRSLFGWEETDLESMKWLDHVWDEDLPAITAIWQKLFVGREPIQFEIRLKKPWADEASPNMNFPYTWILANAYPQFSEDGEIVTIVSSLTIISHLKWAQGDAQRRAAEAVEAKRQQDSFTDMVAHEIRNPLNAIVQCSDAISETLYAVKKSLDGVEMDKDYSNTFEEAINSAETITYCANHQKKIINDLLVLSKLDSDLLTFQVSASQPIRLLQQTTRMFRAQANASNISIESVIHPSIQTHGIDWVMFDPDRVSQVLINLITNAIKFTAQQEKRHITITLEVATDPVNFANTYGIRFFPTNRARSTPATSTAASENLFLLFSVKDTGRGVSRAEQERLFQRFSQASLRTHVKYGGSGLGLWISRELTEMQGGEIGLVPDQDTGSTFAFYVPTSHARPPPQNQLPTPAITPVNFTPSTQQQPHNVNEPTNSTTTTALHAIKTPTENGTSTGPQEIDLKQITILLTEDNILNQNIMKRQLSKVFKTVLVANDGQDTLDIVRRTRHWRGGPPSPPAPKPESITAISSTTTTTAAAAADAPLVDLALILMDIEMPVMGGVECTRRIRALEREGALDKHIPIVAISANARAEQVREYVDVGMDETLAKPFLIGELVGVIRGLL